MRAEATLFLLFCVCYLAGMFPVFPPDGDAADYASLVRHGVTSIRASHIGYFLFARPFALAADSAQLPLVGVLNAVASICMAAAISLSFSMYRSLGLSHAESFVACAALGTSGLFWYHGSFAELQALLMLAIVIALRLFLSDRPALAGAAFAFAMLVSQAAAPSALAFPAIALARRRIRPLVVFAVSAGGCFALGVAPIATEYFFGARGVTRSLEYYGGTSFGRTLTLLAVRFVENHNLLAIPAIGGAFWAWTERRTALLWFCVALFLGHAWVNTRVGHIEFGFAWMPFMFATAALAGIGVQRLGGRGPSRERIGPGSVVALVASAALNFTFYVEPKRERALEFDAVLADVRSIAGSDVVMMRPHHGFVYAYRFNPDRADVFDGDWTMPPKSADDWPLVAGRSARGFALEFESHSHLLRRALANNAITARWLDSATRARWASESEAAVEERIADRPAGWTAAVVRTWPHGSLWQVRPPAQ